MTFRPKRQLNFGQRDISNRKTRAKRGFQFSAGCKGQLSNFFVEDMQAIDIY